MSNSFQLPVTAPTFNSNSFQLTFPIPWVSNYSFQNIRCPLQLELDLERKASTSSSAYSLFNKPISLILSESWRQLSTQWLDEPLKANIESTAVAPSETSMRDDPEAFLLELPAATGLTFLIGGYWPGQP
jgi:hypothetical protein